ncbi:hypothetical protein GCM10022279_09820 [Comamonas faecalis]|uniref:Outer membrane protein assembly factor BamE domain-containing protein n=1 Tax=Comamonas faecalis TaxID=1387849 RepID=A0ABP7QW93_9BURK
MSLLQPFRRAGAALLALCALLPGCDQKSISELEEGVSTEAQVRQRFGEPERIWQDADGARTFEYNRQPAGERNYMITIGSDGVLRAIEQVLSPHHFERVQPGMTEEQVHRLLGKPARQVFYELKQQGEWYWNWADGTRRMDFTVVFDKSGHVLNSYAAERLPDGR